MADGDRYGSVAMTPLENTRGSRMRPRESGSTAPVGRSGMRRVSGAAGAQARLDAASSSPSWTEKAASAGVRPVASSTSSAFWGSRR